MSRSYIGLLLLQGLLNFQVFWCKRTAMFSAFQATPFVLVLISARLTGGLNVAHYPMSECHSHNVLLDCPPYHAVQSDQHSMDWLVQIQGGSWQKLASWDYGDKLMYRLQGTKASRYHGRIELQANGSLLVTNLEPDDETKYRCEVREGSRRLALNIVTLNVSCDGRVTESSREVCSEEDIVLQCLAKDRTNPRKLSAIRWRRRHNGSNRWLFLAATNGSGHPVYNPLLQMRIRLLVNGSLLVRGGRPEEIAMYVCEATKANRVSTPERHQVSVKSIKCTAENNEGNDSNLLQPCIGGQMTVRCPALGHAAPMQVRLLKWRSHSASGVRLLVHVRAGRDGIQNWFLRVNGSRNSRVRLGPSGELIVSDIRADDRGAMECVIKTKHHSEPFRHFTTIWPVTCSRTTKENNLQDLYLPTTAPLSNKATTTGRAAVNNLEKETTSMIPNATPLASKGTLISLDGNTKSAINKERYVTAAPLSAQPAVTSSKVRRKFNTPKRDTKLSLKDHSNTVTPRPLTLQTSGKKTELPFDARKRLKNKTNSPNARRPLSTRSSSLSEEPAVDGGNASRTSFCGEVLTSRAGEIQSPKFPYGYPPTLDCRWTVQGSELDKYHAIRFSLVKVSLEEAEDCIYDYLAFEDALGNQVGCKHCSLKKPGSSVVIKGRVAVVIFHSDATVSKAGFHLTFSLL